MESCQKTLGAKLFFLLRLIMIFQEAYGKGDSWSILTLLKVYLSRWACFALTSTLVFLATDLSKMGFMTALAISLLLLALRILPFGDEVDDAASDAAGAEMKRQLDKYLKSCSYCKTCRRVRPSARQHKSDVRRRTGEVHELREMTSEEYEQEAKAWLERYHDKAATSRQVAQKTQELAEGAKEREILERAAATAPPPYKMEFGTFKKKTLDEIKAIKDTKENPNGLEKYLGTLVAMDYHIRYPRFREALVEAGLLDALLLHKGQKQHEIAQTTLEHCAKAEIPADRKYDDLRKLNTKKIEQAHAILDSLPEQDKVGPVVLEDGEAEACAPLNLSKAEARRQQRRRRREQKQMMTGRLKLKQCMRCGGVWHNKKTCLDLQKQRLKLPSQSSLAIVKTAALHDKSIAKTAARVLYTDTAQRSDQYSARKKTLSANMATQFLGFRAGKAQGSKSDDAGRRLAM